MGAAWTGVVLADIYRPHAPDAELALPPTGARRSDSWSDWHQRVTVIFLLTATGVFVLVEFFVLRSTRLVGRRAVVVVGSASSATAALVTLVTRRLVEWDQLALTQVAPGSHIYGYWVAAFGDDVRFVLIGNTEVSQAHYALAVLTHLSAPMIGAVALVAVGSALFGSSRATPDER
jgi:hypothetical protein